MQNKKFTRVNFQIRVPNVRVIRDGEQIGIMPTDKARTMAQEAGLDLVEVVPQANPPVCHIVEYNKYRYQQKQKEKEQHKKQREAFVETKEIRLRPAIQIHDVDIKINNIKKFLSEGKRVQLSLEFKNREITHKEEGFKVMNYVISALGEEAIIDQKPKLNGSRIFCLIKPLGD